ncbi:MAG: GAF domain-containing protein [bacterium]|nr:GAF domain-containing protein [Candidatus Kapabacteria bacterium]
MDGLDNDAIAVIHAEVERAAHTTDSLPHLLQHCAESMVRHLDLAFARVWTLNATLDVLMLQASAGRYTHLDGAHSRVSVGAFKIGRIAQQRRAHLTNDVQNDPAVDREWASREGMIAFAGYPLMVDEDLVGVLGMFAKRQLSLHETDGLQSIAQLIANAIQQRQLAA